MASVRSLSAFPAISSTDAPTGGVGALTAEMMKKWVWMVSEWEVDTSLSVDDGAGGTRFVYLNGVGTGSAFRAGGFFEVSGGPDPVDYVTTVTFLPFADELEILDWRVSGFADYTGQAPTGAGDGADTIELIINDELFWRQGPFDPFFDPAPGAPFGAISFGLYIDTTDDAGGAFLTTVEAPGLTPSAAYCNFDGQYVQLFETGRVFTGTIDITPYRYWGYDGRYDTTTGAPIP